MGRITPPKNFPPEFAEIGQHIYDQLNKIRSAGGVTETATVPSAGASSSGTIGLSDELKRLLATDLTFDGTDVFTKGVVLGVAAALQSPEFASGMLGRGFRLAMDSDGTWALEVDKIRIRQSMAVLELLFQQVRATNGSIWVSSTGKVKNFKLK